MSSSPLKRYLHRYFYCQRGKYQTYEALSCGEMRGRFQKLMVYWEMLPKALLRPEKKENRVQTLNHQILLVKIHLNL